jgi:succinate-acetate transporter protein
MAVKNSHHQDLEAANHADPAPRPAWSAAIGNPAPLGLLAFGMTTFFLMSVDTLWSGKVFVGAVIGYAYAYGGFAQMVAGVLEVRVWTGAALLRRTADDDARCF